jgi:hypothetical protein
VSIRVVDPTCTECGRLLTDAASRAFRIGPECRKDMTTQQLRAAMLRAKQADDPFRIPEQRPASVQARINNHNARAAADPAALQLCRHENRAGACADCKREANPWLAAERILGEVRTETHAERRAARIAMQAARVAAGLPAPAEPPARAPLAPAAAVQLELA